MNCVSPEERQTDDDDDSLTAEAWWAYSYEGREGIEASLNASKGCSRGSAYYFTGTGVYTASCTVSFESIISG
jgi:hypothetical protein